MTTAFKTVQDALVALLLQAPQITGARVYAGRARPMPAEHDSDISVSLETMGASNMALSGAPLDWGVTYGIELRARGSASVDGIAALDPLFEAAYSRIAAATPPAGVMGWVLQPRVRISVEEAATPVASLQLALDVRLRTQPASLALAT